MAQTQSKTAPNENGSQDLNDSPMMAHLLKALKSGTDIGHYGRLTFVMIARHFLSDDEIVKLLSKQPDHNEAEARALLQQVKEHNYNPPKRERILQWQSQQDFPICPDADNPDGCNVYQDLRFPPEVYEHINEYYEEKSESHK